MRRDDDADEVPYSHSHRAVLSSKAIGDFSLSCPLVLLSPQFLTSRTAPALLLLLYAEC